MGRWKGVSRNLRKNVDAPQSPYHLEADIGEQRDVSQKHPDVAARIHRIMIEAREAPAVERFHIGRNTN